ncbi:shufflon system plasmid conjugative transfer pilus tip adhesin PilV [Erwinia sp. V90_4]|uniref:shufflon system plasmid conjugative transfer pilus tip adhesin PilV n=1 Tax=Erwinia sp. V90_4 TaxID=3044239 RepID=UPI00249E778F|nr:shufflon system plasmid conjugative transfer pilus tip adhesin PilV [Erwinia sp. V90_4]MDI3440252.1 shufflon system plasmid conjugative transfer pilus tip adhesin PilV [Erwinia sp. V90_4]
MMIRMKRGIFGVTDTLTTLGIVMIFLVAVVFPASNWMTNEYRGFIASSQAKTVERAVNKYIGDNATTIAATATPTSPYTLTVPTLVSSGYLPTGFSSTNNYSATYQTRIYEPANGKFHAMTFLTGGADLSISQASKIATKIGATGGYIENGVAKGALGAWSKNLSAFGGFNPGDGHIVIAGFYQNGTISNDYLYRKAVPGRPELNTMSTALNMGGNGITNAATVAAQNATVSGTTTTTQLTATNSTVSGKLTAGTINASGNITSANTVQAKYLYPTQTVTVGQSCSPSGMIGKDSTGNAISCVNGRWAKSSGVPVGTIAIWGSYNIPDGWLECNGQGFNTGVFTELAALYPSGKVPDFRGVFLRGLDRGVGRDVDAGRGLLSYQGDALQNHTHIAGTETAYSDSVPTTGTRNTPGGAEIRQYNNRTGDVNTSWGGARTSSETRPKNNAVLYIIKAR